VIVNASSPETVDLLDRAAQVFRGAEKGVRAFALAENALASIALEGDDIVGWCWGYVLCRPDGTAMAYFHELEVAESHRRRRVGTDLMRSQSRHREGRVEDVPDHR